MPANTASNINDAPQKNHPALPTYPLSLAQMGIWLGQQLTPNSPHYNTAELIEFSSVEPQRLLNAINEVLKNCAPLNTRFFAIDGQAEQTLIPPEEITTLYDAQAKIQDSQGSALSHAKQWAQEQLKSVIQLDKEPPYRSTLIKLDENHYAWFLMIHHIACDGFSYSIIGQHVAAHYRAPQLPAKVQWQESVDGYKQLLTTDQQYQNSEAYQQDKDYWLKLLENKPAPVTLTAKKSSALNFTQQALRSKRKIPQAWLEQFNGLCQHNSEPHNPCHWAHGLNALVAAFMFQHTGSQYINLGQPVMNRMGSAALKIPAMVMNIVPLPIDLSGVSTFNTLLKKVCRQLVESKKHNRYRYEQLNAHLKQSQHAMDNTATPLRAFGPVVNVMPFDRAPKFSAAKTIIHPLSAGPVEDISFSFSLTSQGDLLFLLDANPNLYDSEQLEAYMDRFLTLSETIITQQGHTPLQVNRNVTSWLIGEKTKEPSTCALSALYAAIQNDADKVALEYFDDTPINDGNDKSEDQAISTDPNALPERQTISYQQLGTYIVDCAQTLAQQGVHSGDCVIVALPRGPWSIVISFACLALNAQFIFIDPTGPQARNLKIIKDAKPKVAIFDTQHQDVNQRGYTLKAETAISIVALESIKQFAMHSRINANAFFEHLINKEQDSSSRLAYGIYTSGSTGQPKGVMIDQQALNDFISSANDVYQIKASDRVLHFAPMHFDTCIEEIFITLCTGATLVIRNDDMLDSMAAFNHYCEALSISVLDLPTAFWHEWVFYCSQQSRLLPSALHTVIIGGEAALEERVKSYQALPSNKPIKLLNTYGPSETTVVASCAQLGTTAAISPNVVNKHKANFTLSIGRPLPNRQLLIVRTNSGFTKDNKRLFQLAQKGEDGELVIAGQSLAQGYLNNPEQTQTYFTQLALGGAEAALPIYCTGDRARINADGNIEYLGRIDNEIKISGQRINPAEIESTLLQESNASEVAVIIAKIASASSRTPSLAAPRIIAYIANSPSHNTSQKIPDAATLRQAVSQKLPAVMVPQQWIFCDILPKTPSGKVDKKQLLNNFVADHQHQFEHKTSNSEKEDTSEYSSIEKNILVIWQEVLGLTQNTISSQDDFFVLGGQSLQLLQIATRLSAQLQCDVPVSLLFQHPTASTLAEALAPLLPNFNHKEQEALNENGVPKHRSTPSDGNSIIKSLRLPSNFPQATKNAKPTSLSNIFLTGASGFVGIQLLHHLMATTSANITCLIRANNQQHAWEKIAHACRAQNLPALTKNARIHLILGSIEAPLFGLSQTDFNKLADNIDAVVHNAAITSIVRSYDSLAAANVSATIDCLRIAAQANATLHYVSTIAIGASLPLPEQTIAWHEGLNDGYQQSKWASESLIAQAQAFGVKSCIYRLPRVVGETRTGFINAKDLVWKIIAASERINALPITAISEPWLPVDIAAHTISQHLLTTHSATHENDITQVINCVPEKYTDLNALFEQLAPRYRDKQIAMPLWLKKLALSDDAEDQALSAFFQHAPKTMTLAKIDNQQFYSLLSKYKKSNDNRLNNDFSPYIASAEKQGLLKSDPTAGTPKSAKRTPPRLLEVQACFNPHPQLRRILLTGDTLRNFPVDHYGGHIKIFLPRAHQQQPVLPTLGPKGPIWPADNERPITRTYSVRYYNPVNNTLAIDFVMHKHSGPAASWAQKAKPGDLIGVAGPGGPNPLLAPAQHHIIAGDLTALPAIQAIIEALPSTAKGAIFIAGEAHGFTLQHNTQLEIHWLSPKRAVLQQSQQEQLQRQEQPQKQQENKKLGNQVASNSANRIAQQVLSAIQDYVQRADLITQLASDASGANTPLSGLAAGENSLVLAVRDYLRTTFKLPKALLYAVPYWRNGQDEEGYHQQRHTIMDEEY